MSLYVCINAYKIPSNFGTELCTVLMKTLCVYAFFKYIHSSQNFPGFETTVGIHINFIIKITYVNKLVN